MFLGFFFWNVIVSVAIILTFSYLFLNCVRKSSENIAVDKYIQEFFAQDKRLFFVLVPRLSTVNVFI